IARARQTSIGDWLALRTVCIGHHLDSLGTGSRPNLPQRFKTIRLLAPMRSISVRFRDRWADRSPPMPCPGPSRDGGVPPPLDPAMPPAGLARRPPPG